MGVTTNPSIFAAALANGERYDEQVRKLASEGADVDQTVFALTTTDVRNACDVLKPIFDATNGVDGRVSIEVAPDLAFDTDATLASAKELWKEVDRENLFIKIPATTEGAPAISDTLAEGISVNVTLIFGLDRYQGVMDAYVNRAREGAGIGAGHLEAPFGRLVLRLPRRHRDRQPPEQDRRLRRAARQGRGGQRPPGLRGLREVLLRRSLGEAGGCRSQPPAARCGPRPA